MGLALTTPGAAARTIHNIAKAVRDSLAAPAILTMGTANLWPTIRDFRLAYLLSPDQIFNPHCIDLDPELA